MLVVGRTIQGLGAAAMLPSSLSLINHAAGGDGAARARAVGWWTAAGAATIAAGPILGGLLVEVASWRSIFLVNIPICVVGAALAWRLDESSQVQTKGLDLAGQSFAIIALACITAAVIEGKAAGDAKWLIAALGVVGGIAAVAFVLAERRQESPMLPLSLFRDPSFSAAVIYGVAVNLTYYGMIFVLTLYLQHVLGYGAMRAGLAYLPLTATFFLVNLFSGWLVGRIGSRVPMTLGALVDALGFALLLMATADSRYLILLPAFALIPGGMGVGVPAMTTAVLASVDRAQSGLASAALNAARQAGGAIGVALFGSLAGDRPGQIVGGLHLSAMIAVVLLLLTALLAWLAVSDKHRSADAASAKRGCRAS
jgi:DHA2 family methylenomycin A resistance protein-like MFS transporter